MRYLSVIFLGAGLCLASCTTPSYVAFSGDLKRQHQLTEEDLAHYQFYLSETLTLKRVGSLTKRKKNDTGLTVEEVKVNDQISIPKNTPGVFHAYVDENTIAIKFEECEGCVLLFGNDSGGRYTLLAKSWDSSGNGHLLYNGGTYSVPSENSDAHVYIKVEYTENRTAKSRTATGVKVSR